MKIKQERVKICPKCGSRNVDMTKGLGTRVHRKYFCQQCGFMSEIFNEVDEKQIKKSPEIKYRHFSSYRKCNYNKNNEAEIKKNSKFSATFFIGTLIFLLVFILFIFYFFGFFMSLY